MRIGIIGTNWGRMHVGAFRGAGADVHAIVGSQLEKTRALALQEGIPHACATLQELLEVVDAVVIAGPDRLHASHVRSVLAAGRPVFCEKPLALNSKDAWERSTGRQVYQ